MVHQVWAQDDVPASHCMMVCYESRDDVPLNICGTAACLAHATLVETGHRHVLHREGICCPIYAESQL